ILARRRRRGCIEGRAMLFLLSPFGRVSRRGFWLGYVLLFAVLFTGAYFADAALTREGPLTLPGWAEPFQWAFEMVGGPVTTAVLVFLPWTTAMMILKRLHDRGFGGLILVWKIIVLAGLLWLAGQAHTLAPAPWAGVIAIAASVLALLMVLRVAIIVPFLAGQEGDNRFGPDPLAKRG
ncbi:MAG: DUF805 domain-containing protein, partial [Hyphomonadaceae bacterium]|nr:DUF805 domain-containing protein [Hyphomonadaceae bacterium]